MKTLAVLIAGIVLIGCAASTSQVFDPCWQKDEISQYVNDCIHTQDYYGFVQDFGEPDTIERYNDEFVAVWIKNNGDSKYMLRFIFDEATLRSNTWSYVKM